MRTSRGQATPDSRWPTVLFRVPIYFIPAVLLPIDTAMAQDAAGFDAQTLLTLGINLGIIAFAVGTAIACMRATKRARKQEAKAASEAERYALSESTLETVLAAEPQALLTLTETGEPELLVSNLPLSFGVPREPERLLNFAILAGRVHRPRSSSRPCRRWPSAARPSTSCCAPSATAMSRSTAAPRGGRLC